MGWFQGIADSLQQQQQQAQQQFPNSGGLDPNAGGIRGMVAKLVQQQQQANQGSGPGLGLGSLAQLGQGMNSPQPVPGMPPQQMPTGSIGGDPNGPQLPAGGFSGSNGQLPAGGNRGSGQPINQPMGNLQQFGLNPQSLLRGITGAQSLGQMMTLRSPDGTETQQVPADQLQHWLSRGAQQITGAF